MANRKSKDEKLAKEIIKENEESLKEAPSIEKTKKVEEITDKEILKLEEEIKDLQKVIIEKDLKIKEVQAELINYRKRKDEEVAGRMKYASRDLIVDLLSTLDNFEKAFKMVEGNKELSNYLKGFQMIHENILSILESHGVEKINSLGTKFDYGVEEAVMIAHEKDKEDEIILEVFREGYKLYDKVIRTAQVKVNKKEEDKNE